MSYDIVIIGAGLAGLSSALAALKKTNKILIAAKGLGNLYLSSGYINLLGYYPSNSKKPIAKPIEAIDSLIRENPKHPYSLVGKEIIKESLRSFLNLSTEFGIPYTGTPEKNILVPTSVGALMPTSLYPERTTFDVTCFENIVVIGFEELTDFYPKYIANNLQRQLGSKVNFLWAKLGLDVQRELNSFDIALALEKPEVGQRLIKQLIPTVSKDSLIIVPSVLGLNKREKIVLNLEQELGCKILEIPTLPPSVMGYRLAEALRHYLKSKGVEFLIGHPAKADSFKGDFCKQIGIVTERGLVKKIRGHSYVLATGGVLSGGLKVKPGLIEEEVFGLPVVGITTPANKSFFSQKCDSISCAGIAVNSALQPIDIKTNQPVYSNLYAAGAVLAGYDPFIEKSGNGVAWSTGYKAGLLAVRRHT